MVTSEDLRSRGLGFESRHNMLDKFHDFPPKMNETSELQKTAKTDGRTLKKYFTKLNTKIPLKST